MATTSEFDAWSAGQSYEHYMGRWSRKVAAAFLDWLEPDADADWIEIGCGSGALTEAVLTACAPRSILATDQSPDFLAHTESTIDDPRARFAVADAGALPAEDGSMDVVTSALVLNFVPDRVAALRDMQRVLRPGGTISYYVWDYPGGGMGFIDAFWNAAARVDPAAADLNESRRFPFCTPDGLSQLCRDAGIASPRIDPVEIMTEFPDFDAFWHPFTLGAGPAPGYCRNLSEDRRAALKQALSDSLGGDGPVRLPARAWAVKARVA